MDSIRSTCLPVYQQLRCSFHHLRRKRTEKSHNLRGVALAMVDAASSNARSRDRHGDQGRLLGTLWWVNTPEVNNKNRHEDQEHLIFEKAELARLSRCDLWMLLLNLCDPITVSPPELRCKMDNKASEAPGFCPVIDAISPMYKCEIYQI